MKEIEVAGEGMVDDKAEDQRRVMGLEQGGGIKLGDTFSEKGWSRWE